MRANDNQSGRHEPLGLQELTSCLNAIQRLNWSDSPVSMLTDDSRRVCKGALFVAIEGAKADGHDYIAEAVRRGASAVVCRRLPRALPPCPVIQVSDTRSALSALADAFHGRPSSRLCVIGVTGTDGKSTTADLISAVLAEAGLRVGLIGTVQYRLGARAIDSSLTTPDALSLHAMMAEMVQSGVTHLCMEVSSHSLVLGRVRDVRFDVAVLTNVTEDHLDFHKTPQRYIRAKQHLFEGLDRGSFAVINADSPVCDRYRKSTRAGVLTYGLTHQADVTGEVISSDLRGTEMRVSTPQERYLISSPLVGTYNAENILAAAAVAIALGQPAELVRRAVRRFKGVPGRMEMIRMPARPDLPVVCVDYAHTPNALRNVLSTLRPLVGGRFVCVFGCGGDREKQKRPAMGEIATQLADLAVVTSDNSRSEPTEDILWEIASGICAPRAKYILEPDRRTAIRIGIRAASLPGSMVALCGRGNERNQLIGDRVIPFDDRSVAREILGELGRVKKSA